MRKAGKRGRYLERTSRTIRLTGRRVVAHNSFIMARCGRAFNRSRRRNERLRAGRPSDHGSVE